jgi:hypothetical protein
MDEKLKFLRIQMKSIVVNKMLGRVLNPALLQSNPLKEELLKVKEDGQ